MARLLEKIREAYKRHRRRSIRNEFREAIKYGNYRYALDLAEDHYKKIKLTSEDLQRLKTGFNTYQDRLKDLELLIKQ